jgi:streptogramin lyase
MRWALGGSWLMVACASTALSDLDLTAEPTLEAEGTVVIENRSGSTDLIVGAIEFEPDVAPVRWLGEGPWTIEPNGERVVTVRFSPEEVGVWSESLVFTTDRGELRSTVVLTAAVGVDLDGDGVSQAMGDCDDSEPTVAAGMAEQCDGRDNDCDGKVDEDFDGDFDGYIDADACGDDCNDNDGTSYPGHVEECDATDSDCNGLVDDIDALADKQAGVCVGQLKDCTIGGPVEPDYTVIADYQAVETRCDEIDNDCDGGVDDFDRLGDGTSDCTDDDGDGEREVDGDCDDTDPDITAVDCGAPLLLASSLDDGWGLVDLATLEGTQVATGGPWYDGAPGADGQVWLTRRDTGRVASVDAVTGAVLASTTIDGEAWAVSAPEGRLFVLEGTTGLVTELSVADLSVVDSWLTSAGATAMTADEGVLWVCTATGWLYKLDVDASSLSSVETGLDCFGPPVVDVSQNRVLVGGYYANQLAEVDRDTLALAMGDDLGSHALRLALTDDAVWVTSGVDRDLVEVDPVTLAPVSAWDAEAQLQGIWWDPYRHVLWLARYGNDDIVAFDADAGEVLDTFAAVDPVVLVPVP